MEASHSLKTQDSNYCFWLKNSESCADVKIGAVSIVAALAAIAIVAGVLLVLAQNGFNLAGINSIAQMIEANWVYVGLGVTGGVLLIDTIIIFAMMRGYLNKTSSEKDGWKDAEAAFKAPEDAIVACDAANIQTLIPQEDYTFMVQQLQLIDQTQYWPMDIKTIDGTNTLYAVSLGGNDKPLFFNTPERRAQCIQTSNCYNRQTLENNIYDESGTLEKHKHLLTADKMFVKDTYTIDKQEIVIIVYPLTENKKTEFYFRCYNTEKALAEFLASAEGKQYIDATACSH